jgi:HPt (histidine-containing phosphotransfer) domain-containing protein
MQSESPGPANNAACNLRAALERLDGDAELLSMLITVYLEDSVELLSRLGAAIDARDAASAERAAHSLKGLASNFDGFPAVEAALVIETAARQGEWPAMIAGLPPLEQEVSRLRQALADCQQRQ